jgi:hypothetical protein
MLRRRKKYLEGSYNCVLYQERMEETREHLFFDCSSSVSRWFSLGIVWDENATIHHKIYLDKYDFNQHFFMEIFMIYAWAIWKERNDLIFNHKPPSLARCKRTFKAEVKDHFIRIKIELHQSISLWLDAL